MSNTGWTPPPPSPMDASTAHESDASALFGGLSIVGASFKEHSDAIDINEEGLRLVHQSSSSRIYRDGRDHGVKVILDRRVSGEAIRQRIEHERRITNDVLPVSVATRRITRVAPRGGRPAFRFEWVAGVALREWSAPAAPAPRPSLRARLRAAAAVARAVAACHAAGVAHGRLSAAHVVVEATAGGHCAATLIDLAGAAAWHREGRCGAVGGGAGASARGRDLRDLGRVLHELFHDGARDACGDDAYREACGEARERDGAAIARDTDAAAPGGRQKRERRATAADHAGLPAYLSALIAALARSGGGEHEAGEAYAAAQDVVDDLRAAVRSYDVYFATPRDVLSRPPERQLLLPGAFYGRTSEVSMLVQSLEAAARGVPSVVTAISGSAGMGKTSLANQIIEPLKKRNGRLIRAKFDQHAQQPDSILFSAVDAFLGELAREGGAGVAELGRRIAGIVGHGVGVLATLLPNLGDFVHCVSDDDTDDGLAAPVATQRERSQMSKYLLCGLLRALCTPERPVALLIDDAQWADPASLDLVRQMLTDRELRYCYCILSYRDDDARLTPLVTEKLDAIRRQGTSVQAIALGPIEKEAVVTLVSEALCLPPSLSRPLTSLLHSKTGGAALFITNFLRTLHKDGLIRLNLSSRRWDYDLNQIRSTVIPADVVKFLTMQMSKLSHFQCLALKVAACLGSTSFDLSTFKKAQVANNVKLEDQLPTLAAAGFMYAISPNKFMWAHDTVRQAAYELIPQSKRDMIHLLIGTKILLNTTGKQLEHSIFDIVSQMTMGKEHLQSDSQKYEVADLNLTAGRRAVKTFAFNSAAVYFQSGVQLLTDDCWEQQYNLSLNLHDAAMEASYATGNFNQLRELVSITLAKANTFDDKLCAYQNRIQMLKSSGLASEAVSESLFVIGELGEELPAQQLTNEVISSEYARVKSMLLTYTEEDLLQLPVMSNSTAVHTMEHLRMLISSCANVQPRMGEIAILRMVKMSIEWGLCDNSAFAFAVYGGFLCSNPQDYEGAYRYGKVALQLLDRLPVGTQNRVKARVYVIVFFMINIFKEPYQASRDKLLDGYSSGCQCGELEWAFYCLQGHSVIQLHAGGNLIKLEQELTSAVMKARQYGQITATILIVVWLASVIEMIGDTSRKDPYKTYFSCTEDALLALQESQKNFSFCHLLCNKKKFVCMFNGNVDGATQYYARSLKYPHCEVTPNPTTIMSAFIDGLIAFTRAQKHEVDEDQWTNIALGAIAKFTVLVNISSWNFTHKLYLLEAEHHVLKGNDALAVEKYDLSITTARKHRFLHEEGLGFERAGDYHSCMGRIDTALMCYSSAKACFERWGASAVAGRMADKIRHV